MIIKVKEFVKGLYTEALDERGNKATFVNPKGDCIDLRAAADYVFSSPIANTLQQKYGVKTRNVVFDHKLIKLGIAMQLPKGFVAVVKQRSSTTKKFKVVMASSGFIDNSYCGDKDEWRFYCVAIDDTIIHKGDRICQFEIRPSQFATVWQKIKWLFTKNIKFVFVDHLDGKDRGGHGSTGVK